MSDASDERLERLEMLLAEEALGQLDESQTAELRQLLEEFPEVDRDSFLRAAAAMDLAFSQDAEREPGLSLPEHLKATIVSDANRHFQSKALANGAARASTNGHGTGMDAVKSESRSWTGAVISNKEAASRNGHHAIADDGAPNALRLNVRSRDRNFDPWRWAGWLVASAAILLFLLLQFARPTPTGSDLALNPIAVDQADAGPTVEQLRQRLLDQVGTRQFDWTAGPTPLESSVAGNVIWNQDQQEGYMVFDGLPINNALLEQYQLWIIDPQRDKHPIDGGVFDITRSGKVIVPIHAKLDVIDPQAFAITIEKPGGVVVSDQSRLPLLASVN